MKNNKKPTLTIGIPAHNEEFSLPVLLDSILKQTRKNYILENIIIACDACTDNTAKVVKQYARKSKFIKLIDDGKRLGQSKRLQNFYKLNKSDIFLTFDADTRLATKSVIDEMTKNFSDPKVGLVGGCNVPSRPKTFVESIAVSWMEVWNYIRNKHNKGVSMHTHHGCVSAVRGSIARKVKYPENSLANDVYLYFSVLSLGYKYAYAKNAKVYYRLPSTYSDYLKQTLRFISGGGTSQKSFPELRMKERRVPTSLKVRAWIYVFMQKPLKLLAGSLLQLWIRILSKWYKLNTVSGIWETTQSTKSGA